MGLAADRLLLQPRIPAYGGWFQVDGLPCHVLPHIVAEIQTMLRDEDTNLALNLQEDMSYLIELKRSPQFSR